MRTLFLLVALTLTFAIPALAEEITLFEGKDNTLYESDTGHLSNGAGSQLFAGTTGNTGGSRITRALIAFDLSGIPEGSTIESVQLTIQIDTPRPRTGTLQLHKLTSDWGEGTSDASDNGGGGEAAGDSATTSDATWKHTFFSGSFWTSDGGDFDPTFSDSVAVAGSGQFGFDDNALAVDLQSWLDNPGTNFGWLIRRSNEASSAIRIKSFENLGDSHTLEVVFVPEPSGAIGTLAAALTLLVLRRVSTIGTLLDSVEARGSKLGF